MHRKLGRQNAVICKTLKGAFYGLGQKNRRLDKLGHCLDTAWTRFGQCLWYVSGVCEGSFCRLGQVTPRMDKFGDCLDTAWTGCGQSFALRFANFAPRTSLCKLRSANFAQRSLLRELRSANFAPRTSLRELRSASFAPRTSLRELRSADFATRTSLHELQLPCLHVWSMAVNRLVHSHAPSTCAQCSSVGGDGPRDRAIRMRV